MINQVNLSQPDLTLSIRQQATGYLQLPPSKSISIRAMLLAALGSGEVKINNILISE